MSGFTEFKAELLFERDADSGNNAVEGSFVIPEGIGEDYLEEFDEPDYREKLSIITSSFSGADSVIVYNGNKMLAVASKRTTSSFEDCADPIDFFNENSKPSRISACLDATGMMQPTFGMNLTQIRNGLAGVVKDEYRAMVRVSTDSMTYPLIFNQENEKTEWHEFSLPIDYIGSLEIEVFVHAGESAAFETVGLNQLDAVLFDKLELFDRANRQETPSFNEYYVYPTLIENDLTIIAPNQSEPYEILIYDIVGRLLVIETRAGNYDLPLSHLTSGTYFYQIKEGNNHIVAGKFIRIQ